MKQMRFGFVILQAVLSVIIVLSLSGCFKDEVAPPVVQDPVEPPSPVKLPEPQAPDPVSENWMEKGVKEFGKKVCSTWWIVPSADGEVMFSALRSHVAKSWPKSKYDLDGSSTAGYEIIVGRNQFQQDRLAQIEVALVTNEAGLQQINWAATVDAETDIDVTDVLKAAAQQAFRLMPAPVGEPPQFPHERFPRLRFPLGIPGESVERYTPHSAPMTSVFDHRMAFRFEEGKANTPSYGVTAFTGETATNKSKMVVEMDVNDPIAKKMTTQKLYAFQMATGKPLNGYKYEGSSLAYDGHPAYDFYAPEGTHVYAAAEGTVVWSGINEASAGTKASGIYVRILHEKTFITQYLHLSKAIVAINYKVLKGDLIGYVGHTGLSVSSTGGKGDHLHFEVKNGCDNNGNGGNSIDPYGWAPNDGKDPYAAKNGEVHWGESNGDSVWMWETPR